jgi:oligopeptide transport system substrate-binding protein
MIVNGPFTLKAWKHEYKLELEANPNYYEGEPRIKHLQIFMVPEQSTAFALYLNDQLDFLDNSSFPTPEVERNTNNPEYRNISLLKSYYVGFNVKKKPFDDKRVRLAVSMAIDRSIFPKILRRQEKPIVTFIPTGLNSYQALDPVKFDPAQARKLLAEAGYPDGKGFPHVEVLHPSREDVGLVLEEIQDQLKRNLNLSVDLTNQEFRVYMNTIQRDAPPMFLGNWGADFPDAETFAGVFVSHNGNNHTKWTNPEYDRLVMLAEGEQDPAKRIEYYEKADHLLCREEAAVACTYGATENTLCKPWVHGVATDRIDLTFFKNGYIDNNWHE